MTKFYAFSYRKQERRRRLLLAVLVGMLVVVPAIETAHGFEGVVAYAQEGTPTLPVPTTSAADVNSEQLPEMTEPTATQESTLEPESSPSETVVAEETATVTTEPTAIVPTIDWSLYEQPACALMDSETSAIPSGGALEYRCVSAIEIDTELPDRSALRLDWSIQADVDGEWRVALLPADTEQWIESHDGRVRYAFDQSAIDTLLLQSERNLSAEFRLKVERARCDVVERTVRITHEVALEAPGVEVTDRSPASKPLEIAPVLAPVPVPTLSIDHPLVLAPIGMTADGPVQSRQSGTLQLTVRDLEAACGIWGVVLSASPPSDAYGEPVEGAELLVIEVDGEVLGDPGCDLVRGCQVRTIEAGATSGETHVIEVTIALQLNQYTEPGAITLTVRATVAPLPVE